MRCHRRGWLLFLGLTLAALVPALPVPGAEIDKYIPDDTQIVVSVHVRQILDSPVFKKFAQGKAEEALKGKGDVQAMLSALGLNPLKDINSITASVPGEVKPTDPKWQVIIHGSFEADKLHAAADKFIESNPDGLKVSKEGEARIYELKDNKSGNNFYASLLNKEVLVVAGTKDYLTQALAKAGGGKEGEVKNNLRSLVGTLDGKQSIWLAVIVPDEVKQQLARLAAGNAQMAGIPSKLESLSGGITLSDDVKVNLRIKTSDAKTAKDLKVLLEGFKGLAVFGISQAKNLESFAPAITEVIDTFKFTSDKGTVGVDFLISNSVIEKAVPK